MSDRLFLSTNEYAHLHGISKMQVTRLIKSGKVPAQRLGNVWMIYADPASFSQTSFIKTSNIQAWAKLIHQKLNQTVDVEKSKDRELVYARLHGLNLPHDRFVVFDYNRFPQEFEFKNTLDRLGFPYWISAVPDTQSLHLNRQSKLCLTDFQSGWNFLSSLPERNKYKIIISQYPENPDFKGTALVSSSGHGIAEFATGDRHYLMTRGYLLTNPLLFDNSGIIKYSTTIPKIHQLQLYRYIKGVKGHFEFQRAYLHHRPHFSFFDYTDESGCIEIDPIWKNLHNYYTQKVTRASLSLSGLPSTPGTAAGPCIVTHHEDVISHRNIKKGDILVVDTVVPEMTDYLGLVAGIITDLGGVTSHAAIILRALKIPTIVGANTATSTLRTGQKISLNASTGTIRV